MKLLLTMNLPITRKYGGAVKSNRILAEEMIKSGHELMAVTPALTIPSDCTHEQLLQQLKSENVSVSIQNEKYIFELNGLKVNAAIETNSLNKVLQEQIREFKPDWILISTEDTSHDLLQAAYDESPHNIIYLAHTQYMLPFGRLSFQPNKERTELIGKCKSIITISQYMADYIKESSGFETFVNQPPHFENDNILNVGSFSNKYVLMNNPCAVKGISILLELARLMPKVQFAVIPGWGTTPTDLKNMSAYSNITFLKSTSDLNSLFMNASILLMPSIWEEGFGMTTIDAMSRGVPVVSSNNGGLPEAKLGTNYQISVRPITEFKDELDENKFPIVSIPEQDIEPWKNAIESLLGDKKTYDKESEISRTKAMSFISSLSVSPLIEHLLSLKENN